MEGYFEYDKRGKYWCEKSFAKPDLAVGRKWRKYGIKVNIIINLVLIMNVLDHLLRLPQALKVESKTDVGQITWKRQRFSLKSRKTH